MRKRLHLYIICLGGDKMQLKKNEIKIIQLLLASDNYISSYEIANSTGISRRRVRDEMKIVKDILRKLLQSSKILLIILKEKIVH